jgi:prepilin-type N-terminal cleavage/methylation domain-containing protein
MRQETTARTPVRGGTPSAPAPLRQPRGGFTLIEMLVVVLIMALLMGLLVRGMRNSDDRSRRAQTIKTIEQVSAALEEFFAEYGQYPPVPVYQEGDGEYQPIYFEFPMEWTDTARAIYSGTRNGVLENSDFNPSSNPPPDKRIFTLGLVAFLKPRYTTVKEMSPFFVANPNAFHDAGGGRRQAQWEHHTPAQSDDPRDLAAIARWAPFLEGAIQEEYWMRTNALMPPPGAWLNRGYTIKDAWGFPLHYESKPPHQTYRLWSDNSNMKD